MCVCARACTRETGLILQDDVILWLTHRPQRCAQQNQRSDRQVRQTQQDGDGLNLEQLDVGQVVKTFVRVNWGKCLLWAIGVLLMLAAPSPVKVSPEMEEEYDSLMLQAQQQYGAKIESAQQELYQATQMANARYSFFSSE